jgi:hypothetical protein
VEAVKILFCCRWWESFGRCNIFACSLKGIKHFDWVVAAYDRREEKG